MYAPVRLDWFGKGVHVLAFLEILSIVPLTFIMKVKARNQEKKTSRLVGVLETTSGVITSVGANTTAQKSRSLILRPNHQATHLVPALMGPFGILK